MKLHVIVPARNERLNIPYFYERARAALESLDLDWSILFVNNASQDDSLEQMLKLRASDHRVKIITLSRDFGYHAALIAGLSQVEGDYYAIVDVDCEDPPEVLAEFYKALQGGAQVAYGVRSNRDEPRLITFGRKLFYLANRRVADSEIVMWMGEFSMMTKQVRDAILAPSTTFPFLRAEMGYVGFERTGLPYLRAKRTYGESHYSLWRMARFATAGILSGSTFPLRFVLYLAAFLVVAFPVAVLGFRLNLDQSAKLAMIVTLYFALVTVPIIALYLARTYKNGVSRSVFVVDRTKSYL